MFLFILTFPQAVNPGEHQDFCVWFQNNEKENLWNQGDDFLVPIYAKSDTRYKIHNNNKFLTVRRSGWTERFSPFLFIVSDKYILSFFINIINIINAFQVIYKILPKVNIRTRYSSTSCPEQKSLKPLIYKAFRLFCCFQVQDVALIYYYNYFLRNH